jgi:hypothetical protein
MTTGAECRIELRNAKECDAIGDHSNNIDGLIKIFSIIA